MKNILNNILSWIIIIVTLPISFIIISVAHTETFIGDLPPKYLVRWFKFISNPLNIAK